MPKDPKLLPIHIYGDKVLRLIAEEITTIDQALQDFAIDLTHTMYERDGLGLAAPQVGVSKRMIVIDPYWNKEGRVREPVVMINPVIESRSGETENEEGCISLPGLYAYVVRPSEITVTFTNLQGEKQRIQLSGYPAVVVQHEYDHLEGKLFIDYISTITRLKLSLKLKEMARTAVDGVNIRATT